MRQPIVYTVLLDTDAPSPCFYVRELRPNEMEPRNYWSWARADEAQREFAESQPTAQYLPPVVFESAVAERQAQPAETTMAIHIPADSTQPQKEVKPANGKSFTLKEMQSYVGGMIEIIDLPDGRVISGEIILFIGDLPEDDDAPADYVAGDVLICAQSEVA